VGQAAEAGRPLAASGLHVAAAGMRRLVDTRSSLRASMAERGETLPQLGVSPGFKGMRWPHPLHEGDIVSYSDGDGVETRDFQAKMGADQQQFSRRQPTPGGGFGLLQRRSYRPFSVVLIARRLGDV
jgi:hypothetical protein